MGFFVFWKLNEEVRFEEYDEEGYRECEDAVVRWVKTRRKIKEREERKGKQRSAGSVEGEAEGRRREKRRGE